jgi:hypothetical protein
MEKEVDKKLERNGKREYNKISKLFCLGYLMSTILFCKVWFWNKKMKKKIMKNKQ